MSGELLVSTADARWPIREGHVRGQLTRLRRGRYGPPGQGEALAVSAAVCRLEAVASLETAASIWGIPTLGAPAAIQLTRVRRAQGPPATTGWSSTMPGSNPRT